MQKQNSIITYIEDYGFIKSNLKAIMDKQNISKNQIVKQTGLHHQVIERYMTDNVIRFDREILAKLCYVLNCNLDEIIYYEKPKDN